MNTKQYIESGILEEYVLGIVSPQEKREVECLSNIYPEIRHELDTLSAALERYAMTFQRIPPDEVKEQLLKELDFTLPVDPPQENVIATPITSEPLSVFTPEEPVTNSETIRSLSSATYSGPTYRVTWLVATSIGFLVLVFSFFLYSQLQGSQEQITELRNSNQQLQSEARQLREQQQLSNQTLAVLKKPDTRVIQLNAVDSTSVSMVTVYWNTRAGLVNLEIDSLPQPPESRQYQLWAIVDGKPLDAGVFEINSTTKLIQQINVFHRVEAFAITLEKWGGSSTPTLGSMVVFGKVSS